jgi:hypothetical protein
MKEEESSRSEGKATRTWSSGNACGMIQRLSQSVAADIFQTAGKHQAIGAADHGTAGVTRSSEVLSSSETEQATASQAKSTTAISSSQIAASMIRSN